MAINRYFETFPKVTYSNTSVIDITKRVAVLDSVSGNPYIFYPYEIVEAERPDQFSNRYYQDPFKEWILYLTNKMTDPYHEWYMQPKQLEDLCEKKYGSLFNAQNKIKYYQNDYLNEQTISPSGFNALPQNLKKYWVPEYNVSGVVIEYKRRKAEWATSTNKIVKYILHDSNNYIIDEMIDIRYDNNNFGKGQILSIQGNTMFVNHVSGQYFSTNTINTTPDSYIYGHDSDTRSLFTDFEYVANTIPVEELSYWRPVSYYEYENERNEFNKTVSVLDSQYSKLISDNLKKLMKE